jgi:hypothetical protein
MDYDGTRYDGLLGRRYIALGFSILHYSGCSVIAQWDHSLQILYLQIALYYYWFANV